MTYVRPSFRHPALHKNELGYTVDYLRGLAFDVDCGVRDPVNAACVEITFMSVVTNIEELAFSLPVNERAKLAERLWQSIPEDYISDEELAEALARDREMDEKPESVMTHEEFFASFREHTQ